MSQAIQDGEEVKAILGSPAFKAAVERVRAKHFAEFQAAKTHGASVGAWSRGQAMDDLLTELQATQDRGFTASAEAKRGKR